MNVLKHMEAVFVVTLAAGACAAYVAKTEPPQALVTSDIATPTKLAIVTVTATRPTAAQKLQLLLAERLGPNRA
jgi:hypothetical protein